MKIIVETEELKQEILKQSEYIHDFLINKDDVKNLGKDWIIGLDSDKAGILMHLYMTPQIIEVEQYKVMNKEQEELLGDAYQAYIKRYNKGEYVGKTKLLENSKKNRTLTEPFTKEEFINKCKTDPGFSEMWGLKIEERELSLEERATIWNNTHNPVGNIYTHNQYDENDIPTKLITITYNDKTYGK